MINSIFGLVGDVVRIAVAPVEAVAAVARTVTKPVAHAVEAAQDEIKGVVDDLTD